MKQLPIEKELYEKRFEAEQQQRNKMWHVLCKEFFQGFVSQDDTVLNVATGYGEFINHIHCKKKIACDINPDSKSYVNKDVVFLLGSSVKIALKNNSVDKVFTSNFFEHICREEILQTLHELYRILKPGGKVLVLQPNVRFCYKDYWMFFDHITPIDDRGLTEAFALAQFKPAYKIEKFLPYTTKSVLPKHPFFISLYLHFPFLWQIIGKQSFLVFIKKT